MREYDLLVIGSGPAGQKAAIAAAKLGRKVVLVERNADVGGGSLHQGTIPSKTLREVVSYLSGVRHRQIYGAAYRVKDKITIEDLTFRTRRVIEAEVRCSRRRVTARGGAIGSGGGSSCRTRPRPRRQARQR